MRKELFLLILYLSFGLLFLTPIVSAGGTTEVHIAKYANDGTTLLNETTVDHEWMMRNLEVYGDGVTHYYHQGPIFEDYWTEVHPNETYDNRNPSEDMNVLGKDLGAVKGTNVKDLCDLVGGMSEGDTVAINANDGFSLKFPYSNVYEPDPRQGPMVVTWYTLDANESGEISGYVPDGYSNGMRLVFFADTATNPWGKHVFGIGDMCACLPEDYWHYYQYPDYPTTTGYTMKYINELHIHSSIDTPELSAITVSPADITLDEGETQQLNATAYDTAGNELPNIRFTWSSSEEYIGTIDDNGLFNAKTAGTTMIRAENGTVSGIMNVTVHDDDRRDRTYSSDSYGDSQFSPVLTSIYVSPQSVTINARDDTQQFHATAYDQKNHEMDDIVFYWTNSDTTVGTINTTGFFCALASGTTTLKAANGTVHGTSNVTVSIPAPTETPQVTVTPSPSPTLRPTPTPVPFTTSTPTETPALTATPTPSAPGFEALFVFAGFVACVYVLKRRRSIK